MPITTADDRLNLLGFSDHPDGEAFCKREIVSSEALPKCERYESRAPAQHEGKNVMASKMLGGFYSSARVVYPVHKNSTRADVKFSPLSKRQASKLFHDARRFERRTRQKGNQDGRIGRNGLAILQAMLFDCIDYVSGALFPSYDTLARLANISRRSVARGLAKLKAAGVVDWMRRCHWHDDGTLQQDSNAYAIAPAGKWLGFFPPTPPPASPLPGTWGDHPATDPMQLAAEAIAAGDRKGAQVALEYETDPGSVAARYASFGRTREKNRNNGGQS